MLDRYLIPIVKKPLRALASPLSCIGVRADHVTVVGFLFGLGAVAAVAFEHYDIGLVLLLLNRIADGIDGELARLHVPTDSGAFLDIVLDFLFYALFPLGFALADPQPNALPAAILIASFVGTGASFLAFSDMANRREIEHPVFAYKGLYYLDGLTEGTETILCFVIMCLFPNAFSLISIGFAALCFITAINRVIYGYITLKPKGN